MGLIYPRDLEAWRRWQRRRQPLTRRVRSTISHGDESQRLLRIYGDGKGPMFAVDSASPTSGQALIEPLLHLLSQGQSAMVLSDLSTRVELPTPEAELAVEDAIRERAADASCIAAIGHFLRVSGTAFSLARRYGLPFYVVQHGLLAPVAPPLPAGATLLAWSDADAGFWTSGRGDVDSRIVGSQLLWSAARNRPSQMAEHPTFLGQLHGAELPRAGLAQAAIDYCLTYQAHYRPHPAETDWRSRRTHGRWERRGVVIDREGVALRDRGGPVASVFSTGVLEAAAAGQPAWVTYPDPPPWLREFWERYGMSQLGEDSTPAPATDGPEPAQQIAEILMGIR